MLFVNPQTMVGELAFAGGAAKRIIAMLPFKDGYVIAKWASHPCEEE